MACHNAFYVDTWSGSGSIVTNCAHSVHNNCVRAQRAHTHNCCSAAVHVATKYFLFVTKKSSARFVDVEQQQSDGRDGLLDACAARERRLGQQCFGRCDTKTNCTRTEIFTTTFIFMWLRQTPQFEKTKRRCE